MPKKAKQLQTYQLHRIKKLGMYAVGGVDGLHLCVTSETARSWILLVIVDTKIPRDESAVRRCDLSIDQCPASWRCRECGAHCCQHRCNLRRHDGTAACVKCHRRAKFGLGSFPEISLEQARNRAREIREQIRQGIDPGQAQRDIKDAAKAAASVRMTFKQAARQCWEMKAKEFKNPKHAAQWIGTLEQYAFPKIGSMNIQDIGRAHVVTVLNPIWHTLTETATRVRGRMETVFAWAKAADLFKGENPAEWKGLKPLLNAPTKIKKVEHYHALAWPRMYDFMQKLQAEEGVAARCLVFAILTAARSGEARGATYDEIDLDAKVWTVPANRMKAGLIHKVPLSKEAVALIKSLPRFEGTNLLFPGPRSNAILSDNTLGKVADRITEQMEGKPAAAPHGFRTSFTGWSCYQPGYLREATDLALAHVNDDKTRAAYYRDELLPIRRALMQNWAKFCYTPTDKKVVPMHGKRAA